MPDGLGPRARLLVVRAVLATATVPPLEPASTSLITPIPLDCAWLDWSAGRKLIHRAPVFRLGQSSQGIRGERFGPGLSLLVVHLPAKTDPQKPVAFPHIKVA